MKNNYSLKRSFHLLVIKVVASTAALFAVILILWLIWLSVFPRDYYEKVYSKSFLNSVEKEIPSLLLAKNHTIQNKDSKFQYLITINGKIQIKSDNFPKGGIKLNETSNGIHSFVENNNIYSFKVFDHYPDVKILMVYPAFSTGNQILDYVNVVFQYFIVASPVLLFIFFLSFFTTKLYRTIHSKFKIVEIHLKEIEEGNLSTPLPNFNDKEFGKLSKQVNKMRIELKSLLDESRKKFIVQKQLFSSIAHDVRTPLTIINAETELLELLSDDLAVHQRCSVITSEISRIDQLLTELLKIARLNTDNYTLKYEELNIIDILQSTILEFSSLSKMKKITIRRHYNDNLRAVYCDQLMVTRIIQNILSNAVEHVNVNGEIDCSVIDSPLETIISISNTGSLFSDEYLEGEFTPFYSNKLQREKEHFGLGLYMSDLMIKKMNGSISIKNESRRATVVIALKNYPAR
ncbi:MAG: HAMP domain-containing histidine kinase [Streptococcaceae bacterium]|jgi:signal transduction histidine kinase|nr:HAMP domain-containing histidine kinase [Streptococcaceae bacterium]